VMIVLFFGVVEGSNALSVSRRVTQATNTLADLASQETELTPAQLDDMFEAMAELEALCAGMAARSMTTPERRGLEALHDSLRLLMQKGDPARYRETNEAFHAAIYAGAHNGYLADIALMTRVRVAPFRRAQFRASGRLGGSYHEHDAIVRAILRGDEPGARAAMRDHIGIVRDAFRSYAERRSD